MITILKKCTEILTAIGVGAGAINTIIGFASFKVSFIAGVLSVISGLSIILASIIVLALVKCFIRIVDAVESIESHVNINNSHGTVKIDQGVDSSSSEESASHKITDKVQLNSMLKSKLSSSFKDARQKTKEKFRSTLDNKNSDTDKFKKIEVNEDVENTSSNIAEQNSRKISEAQQDALNQVDNDLGLSIKKQIDQAILEDNDREVMRLVGSKDFDDSTFQEYVDLAEILGRTDIKNKLVEKYSA